MAEKFYVGQRLSYDSVPCTVRYIGPVEKTKGEWLGVEWDYPNRGKHDGEHQGKRYFTCRVPSKTAASFIRPTRAPDPTQSFVEAVRQKYASEHTERRDELAHKEIIYFSGKVAEEVGFDKIRNQLAQLHELKIVLVDGMRIDRAEATEATIRETCPAIKELDLSRNLFSDVTEIVTICAELDNLRSLRLNGNRLRVEEEDLRGGHAMAAFKGVKDLAMDEMLLPWQEMTLLASQFQDVLNLEMNLNDLNTLALTPFWLPASLSSIKLEHNCFTSLSDLQPLVELPNLTHLYLKANNIASICSSEVDTPKFGDQLTWVDLSYNQIKDWSFIDTLPDVFPGLTGLRTSHNPLYELAPKIGETATTFDEGYMLTVARLGNLKSLNFSKVTPTDRTNAELHYLSTIGKQIEALPEGRENEVIRMHRRYTELCGIHGEPVVRRQAANVNPDFLEARLIKFEFHMRAGTLEGQSADITYRQEIPKSLDIYRLKGIVGRLFGVNLLKLRLVWETEEYDPVQEEEGNDDEMQVEKNGSGAEDVGKLVKRQVELENSTRSVGYCVDGMAARLRVELVK